MAKKARVAPAMVQDRGVGGAVGAVCSAGHRGAGTPPGKRFDCSPSVMENKGMT